MVHVVYANKLYIIKTGLVGWFESATCKFRNEM